MSRKTTLLALLVALALAGCGGNGGGDGGDGGAAEEPAMTTDTPEIGGDVENGERVFASAGCGGCHTLAAAGSNGTTGPNLDESQPDFELVVDRVTNGAGVMPSFEDQLSQQEIADVSAFVAESAGS